MTATDDTERRALIAPQLHTVGDHSWCGPECGGPPIEPPPEDPYDEPPPEDPYDEPPPDADPGRHSWQPVDLGPVLDGTWQPSQPTVGRRTDGVGLFYPGKSHVVVSETEGGKTWLASTVAADEIRAGNNALYLDFEDDEGTIANRLVTIGLTADKIAKHFFYVRPDTALSHPGILAQLLNDCRPTLAILDGITEAMGLHALDPNKNIDAALFGRKITKPIADAGAAVVSLDHVVKDREGRGRYALGAVHKLNGLTGAQYTLENRTPFGVGLTGRSTLRIAKDRPGQLRVHALPSAGGLHWFGDLVIESHDRDFADISIEPPHERDENFRPTELMRRIADALDEHGPLAQRRILAAVQGKTESKRAALDYLILDGYVSGNTPHELIKPYEPEGK